MVRLTSISLNSHTMLTVLGKQKDTPATALLIVSKTTKVMALVSTPTSVTTMSMLIQLLRLPNHQAFTLRTLSLFSSTVMVESITSLIMTVIMSVIIKASNGTALTTKLQLYSFNDSRYIKYTLIIC